jgi:hypothetical protein
VECPAAGSAVTRGELTNLMLELMLVTKPILYRRQLAKRLTEAMKRRGTQTEIDVMNEAVGEFVAAGVLKSLPMQRVAWNLLKQKD